MIIRSHSSNSKPKSKAKISVVYNYSPKIETAIKMYEGNSITGCRLKTKFQSKPLYGLNKSYNS